MYTISKADYEQYKTSSAQTASQVTTGGQKVKTGGLSLLGKVGDFLSRGTYASANFAKSAVEGNGMKQNLIEAWHGLKGQDKTTYSDVLDKMGWKAGSGGMANKVARGLVSFAGDVLLDPTTYLTLGTGSGAKLATKTGTTTLTKAGSREFAKKVAIAGSREAAEHEFTTLLAKSPEMALKYIDKGGVKFAGKTIAGTTAINAVVNPMNKGLAKAMTPVDKFVQKTIGEPVQKVINRIGQNKTVKEATDRIGEIFSRDYAIRNKPLLQRTVQKGRDLQNGLIQQMDETVTKKLAKYSVAEKENVGRAIWSKNTSGLTAREQKLNKYLQGEFDRYFQAEKARGLTKGEISGDYLNQMYENPEVLEQAMKNSEFVKNGVMSLDPFTKERSIKSLAQAERLGLKPIYNVEDLLKSRLSHSIRTTTDYDMLETVLKQEGVISKVDKVTEKPLTKKQMAERLQNPESFKLPNMKVSQGPNPLLGSDMVPATSVPGLSKIKGADKVHISSDVANYLTKMATPKKETPYLLKQYDKFTAMFKRNVLTIFPAYHARNFRGNIFQTIADYGITDAVNPKFHAYANKVLKGTDLSAKVSFGGTEYTVGKLRKLMQEQDILQGKGFFELSRGSVSKSNIGQRAGKYVENEARAATFLMGLEHSSDPLTAAERTKRVLFDYDNLSDTEKNIFKRIFPFYTWTSKAAKTTIENMIKKPGNMAQIYKIMDNTTKNSFMGMTAEERASLPDYLQNQFTFKVKGKDGVVRYKAGVGAPIESIADLIASPGSNLKFSLNPAIKILSAAITGDDMDSGKPLEEVTTKNAQLFKYTPASVKKMVGFNEVKKDDGTTLYTAKPFYLWVLRQPPFSRYASTASVATNDGKNLSTKLLQIGAGINATNSDIPRQMRNLENKYKDEITADLRRKGIIKKNEYGVYYMPSGLKLTPEQEAEAKEVLKAAKDVNYDPFINNSAKSGIKSSSTASISKKPYTKASSKFEAVKKMQAKKGKTVKNKSISDIASRIQGL